MKFFVILISFCLSITPFFSYPQNDVYKTTHFEIHYNVDSVPSCKNTSYISGFSYPKSASGDPDWMADPENPKSSIRTVPYYIRDMAQYLESSISAYIKMGLYEDSIAASTGQINPQTGKLQKIKFADNKFSVYVSGLGIEDGNYSAITGSININSSIKKLDPHLYPEDFPTCSITNLLAKACAHELLHAITNQYYNGVAAKYTLWWWEILAVQGDKLVFPNTSPTEAEMFAMENGKGLQKSICQSWDNCSEDQMYYSNSSFLSYLLYHRPGQKADFKSILLAPVSSTFNISYTRTYLDEYIKKSLSSAGLGYEFAGFCKWLLDEEYRYLYLENAISNNFIKQQVKVPSVADPNQNIEQALPYLSMQSIAVLRNSPKQVSYSIKNMNNDLDLKVLVYENNLKSKRKLIRELYPYAMKDSIVIKTKEKSWIEIVLINSSMSEDKNVKLSITDCPDFEGFYQGEVIFSGKNPKLDAKYTKGLSSLSIDIGSDGNAKCDFEFHKFYERDGFYAKGTSLMGKVDKTGHVIIIGSVNAITYPKGSIGCCDFPQVLTDEKCIKFSPNPYYWKFEGDIAFDASKNIILKGDIAAGTNAIKFNKASEQLYKFTTKKK